MSDLGRLAATVTRPDGTIVRWGYGELDCADVPVDLSFGTSVPGGFKDCSLSLLRELNPRTDEGLFNNLRIYGPGNQTAWEGRIAQLPRQTGPNTLQPGAVGHSAHLTDFEGFMMVYVDRDPGNWQAPQLARQVAIAGTGYPQGGVPTSSDAGGITFAPTGGQLLLANDLSELIYTAPPGVTIASLQYKGTQAGTWTSFENPTWFTANTADLASAASGSLTLDGSLHTASLTARRYVMLRAATTANVTPGAGMLRAYSQIAAYGNHGLPLHTTAAGEPDGVYASDVIPDILDRAAPLLNHTSATIQATTFPIPHLAFTSPTTAADAIAATNAYHNWDWAVWDNQTFYYGPAGSGVEWQARLADGASLSLEGDTAEQIIDGIIVAYTDGGIQKYAGPVGSGLDVESSYLEDPDVENPASTHGLQKWPVLSMSVPTTDAGAVEIGSIYLAERNLASRRGQITLTNTARHPQEGDVPVWRVRAGDTIRLSDRPGDPARRIVETAYSHSNRSITLTLDSTAHKLDALLERLIVSTGLLTG